MKIHVNITSTRDFPFTPTLWSFKMKTKPSKEAKSKDDWVKIIKSQGQNNASNEVTLHVFTLNNQTLVSMFYKLFSLQSLRYWQGKFVRQSEGSKIGKSFTLFSQLLHLKKRWYHKQKWKASHPWGLKLRKVAREGLLADDFVYNPQVFSQ